MKRAVYLLLGIVLLLAGVALIAGGAAVASVFGSDDAISTAPARIDGSGVALVTENLTVDASSVTLPSGIGTLTLSVKAPDGRAMFAGTAAPRDLDTYLTGAPYDVVVDLTSGSAARTRHVPGSQQPPPPSGQSFWVTQAQGTSPSISTALGPADALVVMNADASSRVSADVVVTYSLAHAWTGGWTAVGAGALAVALSVLAFWRSRVARRRGAAERASVAEAAAAAVGAAAGSTTVLPDVTRSVEPVTVPAWAATDAGSLAGDGLAGPPTGELVVDPAAAGAAALVVGAALTSTSDEHGEAAAQPQAGWYPGDVDPADGTSPSQEAAVDAEPEADSDADSDAEPEAEPGVEPGAEPVSDSAMSSGADDTQEIPPTPAATAEQADPTGPTESDDPMYSNLASWFRDDGPSGDVASPR